MNSFRLTPRVQFVILLLLILSTLIVYWQTFRYGFYFDDQAIVGSSYLNSVSDLETGIKRNRPLTVIIWFAISSIWGLKPAPFHVVAVILHLSCGLALYCMLKTIKGSGGRIQGSASTTTRNKRQTTSTSNFQFSIFNSQSSFVPLIITAIFLLHPLQTESVVYSFQAMTVLPMALSCLLAVTSYVRYRTEGSKLSLAAIFVFTFIASTARESAIVLPVLLWLVELLFLSEGRVKDSLKKWPLFLGCLILAWAVISIGVSYTNYAKAGMGTGYKGITPFTYLTTQFVVIVRYLSLIFFPVGQNLDYDFPIYNTLFSLKPVLSLMVLVMIVIAGLYSFKKKPMFSFGLFWFFLFLAPTSTIVPIKDVIFEHRLYLPLAGIAMSVVSIVESASSKSEICNLRPEVFFGGILIILLFSISLSTFFRLNVWRDDIVLWSDVVKKSPNKVRPYTHLGAALDKKGRYKDALATYDKALRIKPNSAKIYNLKGLVFAKLGETNTAVSHFLKSLKMHPNKADVHYNLGTVLKKQGKIQRAIVHFSEALRIKPRYLKAHNNLGITLAELGKLEEAIAHFSQALQIKPDDDFSRYNLETVLRLKKNK